MLGFEHLFSLLFFILMGGFGMAAMQDGMGPFMKRLRMLLSHDAAKPVQPSSRAVQPLTFGR